MSVRDAIKILLYKFVEISKNMYLLLYKSCEKKKKFSFRSIGQYDSYQFFLLKSITYVVPAVKNYYTIPAGIVLVLSTGTGTTSVQLYVVATSLSMRLVNQSMSTSSNKVPNLGGKAGWSPNPTRFASSNHAKLNMIKCTFFRY